tara:strand:+ start:373 stop:1338 length:966 start_codon:yes stop_codon:yes gene_type:complete
MKILITGVGGFIGFSFANYLLNKKKIIDVYGIDNYDDYYNIFLKKKRVSILKKKKKFRFKNLDITDKKKVKKFFSKKKFDIVLHLAAQAGVRYSLINPQKYIEVNIYGFMNIINCVKKFNVKKFIYASSSSVYGESKKFPLNENSKTNPKNIYGYSKLINEKIAEYFSRMYKINCIGLRFFTAFGPWGRPDMFILKLLIANEKKKFFQLNNSGNHYRDFTSINDINHIIEKLCMKKINKNHIFNICSNRPIFIKKLIKIIEKYKGKLKIKNIPKNKADVYKTHGDNKKILNFLKLKKFSKFENDLKKTIEWFNKKNIIQLF